MDNMDFNAQLVQLAQDDFSPETISGLSTINVFNLVSELEKAKALLTVYPQLDCSLPVGLRRIFASKLQSYTAQIDGRLNLLKRLRNSAEEEGLSYVLFKGVALSMLIYDNPYMRQSGDIDLLVAPEDAAMLDYILRKEGAFQPSSQIKARHVVARGEGLAGLQLVGKSKAMSKNKASGQHFTPYYFSATGLDFPISVEVHDRLHHTDATKTRELMLHSVIGDGVLNCERVFNIEASYACLIENTYENSETVFANQTDKLIGLRDHVDLHYFINRYAKFIDWLYVDNLLMSFGIDELEKVVLASHIQLYPKTNKVIKCRAGLSEWKTSYPQRLVDIESRRSEAREKMRSHYRERAARYILGGDNSNKYLEFPMASLVDCLHCAQAGESILLRLRADLSVLSRLNILLFQLNIIPLYETRNFCIRVDCFQDSNSWHAFAHESETLSQGGHPSDGFTGVELALKTEIRENAFEFDIEMPMNKLGLRRFGEIAIAPCLYERKKDGDFSLVGASPYDTRALIYECI